MSVLPGIINYFHGVFGKCTTLTGSVATIGSTTGIVLAANTSRRYALLQNDSTCVIYLEVDSTTAALNAGIRLAASGGEYLMSALNGNLYTGAIYGITSTDAQKVLVTEGV